jgi:hypothetical protein
MFNGEALGLAVPPQEFKTHECLRSIEGAADSTRSQIENVRTDHGRPDVMVTEQLLNRANVPTSEEPFSIIELRIGSLGKGEGRGVVTGKIAVDNDSRTFAIDAYDSLPAILQVERAEWSRPMAGSAASQWSKPFNAALCGFAAAVSPTRFPWIGYFRTSSSRRINSPEDSGNIATRSRKSATSFAVRSPVQRNPFASKGRVAAAQNSTDQNSMLAESRLKLLSSGT